MLTGIPLMCVLCKNSLKLICLVKLENIETSPTVSVTNTKNINNKFPIVLILVYSTVNHFHYQNFRCSGGTIILLSRRCSGGTFRLLGEPHLLFPSLRSCVSWEIIAPLLWRNFSAARRDAPTVPRSSCNFWVTRMLSTIILKGLPFASIINLV